VPLYEIFEGTRPLYVVSDVDFLQVYKKQFSIFHSRSRNILTQMLKTISPTSLFAAHANQWRRQEHIINRLCKIKQIRFSYYISL
jgi:hypothetical protein